MQNDSNYEDILHCNRSRSDLLWIMKDYESRISYFSNYKSSEFIKDNLLKSPEFLYDLKLLSDKNGISTEELKKEAESILTNMNHKIGMNSVRVMGIVLSKIMRQMYEKIYVRGVDKLRKAFDEGSVILLPTHRSYADFLLISYVMFTYDLPLPVTAAAMDFQGMKFVGELLRRCGAFFIRRSFAKDELYWMIFTHYVKCVVKTAQEPLEFFIEGTRSRTNRCLHPKAGLLGILLELWLSNENMSSDLILVPISISYERILEESLYAWELLGVPKPKESTSGLLKVRHILNENYGSIYFDVCDAISLRELTGRFNINRYEHNLQLRFKPCLFNKEKQFLHWLASYIVEQQQIHFHMSEWSVVAMKLLHFGDGGCVLADNHIHKDLERAFYKAARPANGSTTIGDVMSKSVVYMMLANYRNPLMYRCVCPSLLYQLVRNWPHLTQGSRRPTKGEVGMQFCILMKLLSREFVYSTTPQQCYEAALADLMSRNLIISQDSKDCDNAVELSCNLVVKATTEVCLGDGVVLPWQLYIEAVVPHLISYYVYLRCCLARSSELTTNSPDARRLRAHVIHVAEQFINGTSPGCQLATNHNIMTHLVGWEMLSVSMQRNFINCMNHVTKKEGHFNATQYCTVLGQIIGPSKLLLIDSVQWKMPDQ